MKAYGKIKYRFFQGDIIVQNILNIKDIDILSLINGDTFQTVGIAILIFIFFLILRKIFSKYIFKYLLKLSTKTSSNWDDKILRAYEVPLSLLFIVVGFYLSLTYLNLSLATDIFILKTFRSLLVILLMWGIYDLAESSSFISEDLKEKLNLDNTLIVFFSKVFRFLIIALGIVLVANEWGFAIDGFVAGLGLGGLAFALAAQDALANIVAGIVIIMEKPFSIGDWIDTPSVEGTVEDISFRSTKVRTFAQAMVTVPNSTLAKEAITNWTRMGKRRLTFYLGLTYSTPREKMEICVKKIKTMLEEHPGIHKKQIMVYFEKFNDSSLDIFVYCFTNTTVWTEFLAVREDVNLKIMAIAEEEDVSFAFPSRSIYMENMPAVDFDSVYQEEMNED